jgi:phage terminase Nu1 subunit (DNA packaging protein)
VKLSRDYFAKKCGVSAMAISKAVRSGKVVEDDRGRVDTTDPGNRAYMQADHAVAKRAKAAGKIASRGDESKRRSKLFEAKTIEQTRQYRENANWAVQRRAKDLGLLVERAKVEQMMASFGQELKLRLLDMPRRISANLFGLARAEAATPMAIEGALNKEISEALTACKERARAIGLGSLGS